MSSVGIEPDKSGALDLLSSMRREGVEPNRNSYNAVISACEKASEWTKVSSDTATSMRRDGVEPNSSNTTAAMSACETGEWSEGVKPDTVPAISAALCCAELL